MANPSIDPKWHVRTYRDVPPQAVKAVLVADDFLESQLDELRASVSTGYARGRCNRSRDRQGVTDGRHLLRRAPPERVPTQLR